MIVEVIEGSIADVDADVLVNASNTILRLGSGVSAAIRASCGAGFQGHLDRVLASEYGGGLEPGDVVITDAGAHPRAKYVAHVAVMDYREGPGREVRPTLERIRRASEILWAKIDALPISGVTVGMVALGAGTGGLGLRDSVGASADALTRAPGRIAKVSFVAFGTVEYLNMLDEVAKRFPLDLSALSEDTRKYLASMKS